MKRKALNWIWYMLVACPLLVGCKDEDEDPSASKNEKRYTLSQLDNSGVSGVVIFSKIDDATTKIVVELSGTAEGNSHPAHLHANNATTGGSIVLDFNPVDGATGKSETIVTMLNDGTRITYDELVTYNGHVNVHKSATELSTMLAQGNVGSNATAQTSSPGVDNSDGNGGY